MSLVSLLGVMVVVTNCVELGEMRKLSHARLRRLVVTGVKPSVVEGSGEAVATMVFAIGLACLLWLLVEVDSSSESEVDAQLFVACLCAV